MEGARAVWPAQASGQHASLPELVQERIVLARDWTEDRVAFDAVLHHGPVDELRQVCQQVAQRKGPIIGVQGLRSGDHGVALERLLIERSLSVNTAAAGGNATLMTIG